jgi:hypothetical protein
VYWAAAPDAINERTANFATGPDLRKSDEVGIIDAQENKRVWWIRYNYLDMERRRRKRKWREESRGCIYRANLHFAKLLEATLILQLEKKVRF